MSYTKPSSKQVSEAFKQEMEELAGASLIALYFKDTDGAEPYYFKSVLDDHYFKTVPTNKNSQEFSDWWTESKWVKLDNGKQYMTGFLPRFIRRIEINRGGEQYGQLLVDYTPISASDFKSDPSKVTGYKKL